MTHRSRKDRTVRLTSWLAAVAGGLLLVAGLAYWFFSESQYTPPVPERSAQPTTGVPGQVTLPAAPAPTPSPPKPASPPAPSANAAASAPIPQPTPPLAPQAA